MTDIEEMTGIMKDLNKKVAKLKADRDALLAAAKEALEIIGTLDARIDMESVYESLTDAIAQAERPS